MTTVLRWSGTEVRALRAAKRMSIRGFAAHLGVSDRMISKWEAGAERIHPRSVNQAALDTSLALSSIDVQARFALLLAGSTTPTPAIDPGGDAGTAAGKQVSRSGVYDLCGNVWEWCATETDPGRHELKGSAFTSPFDRATPSAFNDASADMYDDDTGFRCVIPAALKALLQRE